MNKTAIITGTSQGLGLSVAAHLLSKGWKVIGLSRSECAVLKNEKQYIHRLVDIKNYQEVANIFSEFKNENIDLLINNAAVFSLSPLVETDNELIDNIIDTNIKGTIHITKASLNLMAKDSRIIFVNSVAGLSELENQSIYCASKYALTAFAGILGKELRSKEIRITSIHPGGINTTLWNKDNPYPCGNVSSALEINEIIRLIEFVYNSPPNTEYKSIKLFPSVEWH